MKNGNETFCFSRTTNFLSTLVFFLFFGLVEDKNRIISRVNPRNFLKMSKDDAPSENQTMRMSDLLSSINAASFYDFLLRDNNDKKIEVILTYDFENFLERMIL
jgi:hypothetical protein